MSNDIYDDWRSIWRIANQAVPHSRYSRPGAFADLDMLLSVTDFNFMTIKMHIMLIIILSVGLGGLSHEEERFHFGLWALLKSPLLIGADLIDGVTSAESIAILANKEVIAINQDPLGEAAELILRYTEEEWDLWAGNLTGGRKVVGVANWRNETQVINLDLGRVLGIKLASVRDVWAATDLGVVDYENSGVQSVELAGHQLKILILDNLEPSSKLPSEGYYSVADGDHVRISGTGRLEECSAGSCAPSGSVVRNIGSGVSVNFHDITASSSGKKFVGVDFINYDYAFAGAWGWDTNTRNVTISVNGGKAKRWALPLAGNDWHEAGRVTIELDGFRQGNENNITFATVPGETWGPDLVGMEIFG